MRLLGIDEAGRGPVLGPMVVAGVVAEDQQTLRSLGVRDSKRLTPKRRTALAREIMDRAECRVLVIPALELDLRMESMTLNQVEVESFADLIRSLAPDEAWVDCCDPSETRFRRAILRELGYELPLRAEHKADERYPVVSAASIVAKVRRDEEVSRIQEELGLPVGSGYAHDPQTRSFMRAWLEERGEIPPHTRRAWRTSKDLLSQAWLRNLKEWE